MPIKGHIILIADSQYLVTESLGALISHSDEFDLAGMVDCVADVKNELKRNSMVHLLITDYFLLDYTGFDDLAKIIALQPTMKVLILTNSLKPADVNEFSKIGIRNIILKTADRDEIITAIRHTLKGKKYYSDEILDMLIDGNASRDEVLTPALLTPAEIEITRLIAEGLTTKTIAAQKNKSFHTIMSHRKNIFRKLNINSTSALVKYAIKAGLIDNIEYYI
jgi:DNA-binding NarL/FixJ family response regulator